MVENASKAEARCGEGSADDAYDPRRAGSWHQRYGDLFAELKRPARAMVRRAFGRAFGDDEIEDLYANAWLGTLRALERRRDQLGDDELRSYILTAVANQASKELRRRGRRPTAPLDIARGVPDGSALPEERATGREESEVVRDVLGTLPPRRRAVLLFRYGWGLAPNEVCRLIQGLSRRAYRKEITKGVQEVGSKLKAVEEGSWCESREPILHAYVAGVADAEQRRQAEHHLAHCRHCTDYVTSLNGHLHEIGSGVGWTGVADVLAGDRVSIADRLSDAADRARETSLGFLTRGGAEPAETTAQVAAAGGARGAGVGAAGGLAKLAGAGAIPKLVAACVGTGAAATACVATGVAPIGLPDTTRHAKVERAAEHRSDDRHRPLSSPTTLPTQVGHEVPAPRPSIEQGEQQPAAPDPPTDATPEPAPAPPIEQEFGLASESASTGPSSSAVSGGGGTGAGGDGASGGAVEREFGP